MQTSIPVFAIYTSGVIVSFATHNVIVQLQISESPTGSMTPATSLPYRPNVGIALFNRTGLVFAGRALNEGPEQVVAGFEWQMPQGGIDPDEDLEVAARRELFEETGIESVEFLAATEEWWPYDFPPYDGPPHSLSGFRGQTQRWVALRFAGEDRAINVIEPASGLRPEFASWAWMPLTDLPRLVMPHKQAVYAKVATAFARYAQAGRVS